MKNKFLFRALSLLLTVFLLMPLCTTFFAFAQGENETSMSTETGDVKQVLSRLLVLHFDGNSYKETMSHLENSLVASKEVSSHDIMHGLMYSDLENYDCVYVDETVFDFFYIDYVKGTLESYVKAGGSVFLPNCAVNYFDNDFLGIRDKVKLSSAAVSVVNNAKGTDMEVLGEIVCDFSKLFKGYTEYDYFSKLDYGYGFTTSTATPVASLSNGTCLYAVNNYGNGYVFITNPLLPNDLNVNSFDRQQTYFSQQPFAGTTAGANSIIKGEFASFVSKKKNGYSIERTFGSYGTQPVAWQLHYEEITGIENNASVIFSEICKKYNQIPSFTLIRNTYKWFSRYESLSYLDINGNICTLDFNEGAYSNGTHVIADNFNLYTVEVEDTGSYFEDLKTAKQRLYPCIYDVNADGMMDVVAGSSDGKFYVFETKSLDGRWICDKSYTIKDINGNDVDVGQYSAPAILDFDGDGIYDIVSGDKYGNLLFIRNAGNGVYEAPRVITKINVSETMPVVGDVDNDGKNELVVGSCNGKIFSFEIGSGYLSSQTLLIEQDDETFLSPCIYDLNGDGYNDIAAGTFLGYVRRYHATNTGFRSAGYIMANEPNFKGNSRVRFGNNSTPRFFDADSDGKNELVCGSYEYGLNVPIDSPYFPFREQLEQQIKYIVDNNFYLGVHFYTNAFASTVREQTELYLHKKAFDNYGINTYGIGVNQHTWYTSSNTNLQTLQSVKTAGLLWDSGWQSSESSTAPQSSTENVLGYPAFIDKDNKMFAFNTGTLLYLDDKTTDLTAKYGLPMSIYYHCDFAYENKQSAENDVKHVADYVKRNGMSFVKEDQFAKMTAASTNINVCVSQNTDGSVTLIPTVKNDDFPLYDEVYRDAVAVRIEASTENNTDNFTTDAEFYSYKDDGLTVTLNQNVCLAFDKQKEKKTHLVGFNVPATVKYGDGMAVVTFDDNSYVEVVVEGRAECTSKGITSEFDGEYTTFKGFNVKPMTVIFK